MSSETKNLKLFKWDTSNQTDLESRFNIEKSLNENWDKTDEAIGQIKTDITDLQENKIDKEEGKGLSTNDFTNEYKAKLDELENYNDTELKQQITALNQENQSLKNQIPCGQAEGESITIDDSSDLPVEDIKIGGKIEQETREGYNLLPPSEKDTYTNNNVTISSDGAGRYVINGDASSYGNSVKYTFALKKDYTIKNNDYLHIMNKGTTTSNAIIILLDSNMSGIVNYNFNTNNKIEDLSNYVGKSIKYIQLYTNPIAINLTLTPMIINGITTAKEYEQYGAMPSIEYPSEIQSVTGENEVKFQNKNLFDKNTMYKKNTYIDGAGSCSTAYDPRYNYYSVIFPCKQNKTYTISKKSDAAFRVGTLINPPQALAQIVIGYKQLNTATEVTITTSSSDNYILIAYYNNLCSNSEEELRNSIQIEEGSTKTEGIIHEEQLYPISLGDIELFEEGYINVEYTEKAGYKTVTKASVYNEWGKFKLNGSEKWTNDMTNRYTCTEISDLGYTGSDRVDVLDAYCNFAKSYLNYTSYSNSFLLRWVNQVNRIDIMTNKFSDVTEFKNFISENNLIVVYKLKEPTTTEITDETLLAQLEALINAETYKNITHIDTETENLKPNIKLTYRKDLETMFENINNSILSLGGNI